VKGIQLPGTEGGVMEKFPNGGVQLGLRKRVGSYSRHSLHFVSS
jgi:hypothetical protein